MGTAKQDALKPPSGLTDRLPDEQAVWRFVERILERRADGFGFGQVKTPLFESAELFERLLTHGMNLDPASFIDVRPTHEEDSRHYLLRPDGRPGLLRSYLAPETENEPLKLWSIGPVFGVSYTEQETRYHQKWQANFELIGDDHAGADAILIYFVWQCLSDCQLRPQLMIDINSSGCKQCRPKYRKALLQYFEEKKTQLCSERQINLQSNPLRLLQCQTPDCEPIRTSAPQSVEYLCPNCKDHFRTVLESLDELSIPYNLQGTLIDTADSSSRTIFECIAFLTGDQRVVLATGRRSDGLIEVLGGKSTPTLGATIVLDTVIDALRKEEITIPPLPCPDLFIIQLGEKAKKTAYAMVAHLGDAGFSALSHPSKENLKVQLAMAEKLGVRFTVIVGQREAIDGTVILKDMQENTQETVDQTDLIDRIHLRLGTVR